MVVIQVNSIYLNKTTVMLFLPTVSCNQRRFSILLRPVGRQHELKRSLHNLRDEAITGAPTLARLNKAQQVWHGSVQGLEG